MTDRDRSGPDPTPLGLRVNGVDVVVEDPAASLLDVLRGQLGRIDVKDGCAPQGQCGCCTVLVDGAPRVACVTPVRRVRGREIVTPAALPDAERWAEALCATGGTQCGFCTPGIVARLSALRSRRPESGRAEVEQALLAHVCRCTGWQTIVDAWEVPEGDGHIAGRDLSAAARRAELEGGVEQEVSPRVALGAGGFAADTAPEGALVALLDPDGAWTLAESVAEARRSAGTVQGRRTTEAVTAPIALPDGDWAISLQTSWVDPAYLETDASWCEPGGRGADPTANGGAFGAKTDGAVEDAARELATGHGRAVLALHRREDTIRRGPKRPPLAAGIRLDGTGVVRVAATPGIADRIKLVLPDVDVHEVEVPGPPTSSSIRGAGWAEAVLLDSARKGSVGRVHQPGGGWAEADIGDDGSIRVRVGAGRPLDEVTLRSYCTGAAHQGASWVTSEALTVADDGEVQDLTIRSLGVLRAVDTPRIDIVIEPDDTEPVPVSDAVFAAVAAAVWLRHDTPLRLPTGIALRS